MRRVVTGHTPDGKSTVASDTQVKPSTIFPGWDIFSVWAADRNPVFPMMVHFPGSRVFVATGQPFRLAASLLGCLPSLHTLWKGAAHAPTLPTP
jgi:hypothetical protein